MFGILPLIPFPKTISVPLDAVETSVNTRSFDVESNNLSTNWYSTFEGTPLTTVPSCTKTCMLLAITPV